uniref:F-box domain-containing protein n=1 Tax=Mycena chlorophos TaxID=658473 RepID=A0ABQ0L7K2_MYCCL|nr:predicted protein [Mycena chlorophos]
MAAPPGPQTFSVPVYSDPVQSNIDDELSNHQPPFEKFYKGILYPTEGEPLFVDVPVRMGCDSASSPYDLDVLWWVGVGNSPETSSIDVEASSLAVFYWPLDDPRPLKRSYVVFCAQQGFNDLTSSDTAHPINSLINDMTTLPGRGWRGNILILKSALHYGKKNKYEMGVSSMTECDILVHVQQIQIMPSLPTQLSLESVVEVARHSNWNDVMAMAHTCKKFRRAAKHTVSQRIGNRIGRILLGAAHSPELRRKVSNVLLKLLHSTQAAIVGSVPLAILSLTHTTDESVEINDLNILVPVDFVGVWYRFLLESLGFMWCVKYTRTLSSAEEIRGPTVRIRAEYKDHIRTFACFKREAS